MTKLPALSVTCCHTLHLQWHCCGPCAHLAELISLLLSQCWLSIGFHMASWQDSLVCCARLIGYIPKNALVATYVHNVLYWHPVSQRISCMTAALVCRAWPTAHVPYCLDNRLSRLSEQLMARPIVIVTDCLLKCLVYRGGGNEGQFIKVNYHIQSRHGITIIGPTR